MTPIVAESVRADGAQAPNSRIAYEACVFAAAPMGRAVFQDHQELFGPNHELWNRSLAPSFVIIAEEGLVLHPVLRVLPSFGPKAEPRRATALDFRQPSSAAQSPVLQQYERWPSGLAMTVRSLRSFPR